MAQAFRILALDGGGIFGVVSATLLMRLVKKCPTLVERVDLVAGTSTGGLIALALAHGLPPKQIVTMYLQNGRRIFSGKRVVRQLWKAKYSPDGLEELVFDTFPEELTLGHLSKLVLIPTFHLNKNARHWDGKFFHNVPFFDAAKSPCPSEDAGESVREVAMRTSAAPTYFPARGEYIDGGVIANNPSMCAVSLVSNRQAAITPPAWMRNMRVLSLGTGQTFTRIEGEDHDWGLAQWGPKIVDLLMTSAGGVADYHVRQMLGDFYHRNDPLLPDGYGMDDGHKAYELFKWALKVDLTETLAWVQRRFLTDD